MFQFIICFIAGIGAGLGTGFAGMSAAAVISPMLITFLGLPAYEAVGIALVKPVMTTKESMQAVSAKKRILQSVICGILVGFICGFVGAGGGMMMLLILTGILGYELKTAVGTSVFIMTFTALTGAISHFAIGGMPDMLCLLFCVVSTLLWARIAARFANKASAVTLNRVTGIVLAVLGCAILAVNYLK